MYAATAITMETRGIAVELTGIYLACAMYASWEPHGWHRRLIRLSCRYAEDPHGPWMQSREPAYSANVTLVNGSEAQFLTRQRPQLVFSDDGQTPAVLFTSGSFEGNNPDLNVTTHTFAQAFKW